MTGSRGSRFAALTLGLALGAAPAPAQEVGAPLNIVPVQPGQTDAGAATTVPSEVETIAAAPIDAESYGTLGDADGGLGGELWAGADRRLVEALLPMLGPVPGSPTLNDLAARLLMTAAVPPGGEAHVHLLALRLDRLLALGRAPDSVPGAFADATVAGVARRAAFQALLARGDDEAACAEAQAAVQVDDQPLWSRAMIFCQLRSGQTDAALLGLDVLAESGTPLPASFRPLAEAMATGATPAPQDLADATVVEAALARAAGVATAVATDDPWVLAVLAGAPSLPDAARLGAAERAEALGALNAADLGALYGAIAFDPAEIADAATVAQTLEGPVARALLHQAARGQAPSTARAELILAALAGAASPAEAATAARAFAGLIAELPPAEALIWFAPSAIRALLVAGRPVDALAWWRLAQGRDAVVAASIEPLWPLARIAVLDAGEGGAERLALWWQRTIVADDPAGAERSALASALLSALGDGAGRGILADVAGVGVGTETPPTALLAALDAAAAAGRRGETVLLALLALRDGGPAGAPAASVIAAVRGLVFVGLEDEARRLAIEAATAHGL
ncbi:MAG: hypothetical protein WD673_01910 [Alphaproteobacteria bacterium]